MKTVQAPINKALDAVIKTGLKLAGPIIRGIKGISGKVKTKVTAGKQWAKGKVDAVTPTKDKERAGSARSKKAKADALRDAKAELAGREKVDDIRPVLEGIRRKYKPDGLKNLSATASTDLSTVSVTAKASPGEEARIPFERVFRGMGKEKIEELRKVFDNKAREVYGDEARRDYVIAAITIDGKLIGQEEYNDAPSGVHAEGALGPHWRKALDVLAEKVARNKNKSKRGAPYERPQLIFALSASPCQECYKILR